MTRPPLRLISDVPDDDEPLDAYSRAVTFVAERLTPSIANLRVTRRGRNGRVLDGGGSGVVLSADGYMVTSAHVVAGGDRGGASFADGREVGFDVVGADPLSISPCSAPTRASWCPPCWATRSGSASASWWSRSATRTVSPAR